MSGRLIGVGTGPGDPDLLTVKAARAIASAGIVAHFAKAGRAGNARRTVAALIRPDARELVLNYPVTTELDRADPAYQAAIGGFYEDAARRVGRHLDAGRDVVVLSEGDPLFYGSYMHLHVRLAPRFRAEIVPGITAMSGCWSQAGLPMAQGDDVVTVLPGTLSEAELARRLPDADAFVVMKVGRNLAKIRRALAAAGRLAGAVYVERGTMQAARALPLADKTDDEAPYFSLVLGPGWRPKRQETRA